MFSCGCVLAELCTGVALFMPSESVLERVKTLEKVVESFPADVASRAQRRFPMLFKVDGMVAHVLGGRGNVDQMRRLRRVDRLSSLQASYTMRTC